MAQDVNLALPTLAAETCASLRAIYPSFWNPSNPVDAWGTGWDPDRFEKTLEIVAADPGAAMVAMTIMPQPARRISIEVAEVIRRVAGRTDEPFALISDSSGGPREPGVAAALEGSGIAYLSGLRNGLTAIARWMYARPPSPQPAAPSAAFLDQCRVFAERCADLDEPQRFEFLSSIGIPMSPTQSVVSAADAARMAERLDGPVVLKGSAPDILHKSEHDFRCAEAELRRDQAVRRRHCRGASQHDRHPRRRAHLSDRAHAAVADRVGKRHRRWRVRP